MSLVVEVSILTHQYARKGGKDNRKQQRARMIAFAHFCARRGAKSFGEIGKRHVILYWKAHRNLKPSTAYNHYLALRTLWRLAGNPGDVPKPRIKEAQMSNPESSSFTH